MKCDCGAQDRAEHRPHATACGVNAKPPTETFVVVGVTSNRNSFGLKGHVVVNRQGHAYEIGLNYLNERPVNHRFQVPVNASGTPSWASIGAEIPNRLPVDMPAKLLKKVDFGD